MALHIEKTSWHPGELAVHKLLHVQQHSNPTWAGLPGNLAYRVAISPIVAFGALDQEGRPWTTVWGGEAGFARPLQHGLIAAKSFVDAEYDPVLGSLLGAELTSEGEEEGYHITREEFESGKGKLISGLSIDLATRDRVKLAGRLVAGKVDRLDAEDSGDSGDDNPKEEEEAVKGAVAYVQIAMMVQESLGNCPKYLNKKTIRPHRPTPRLVSDSLPLPREALELLDRADLFFLSSTDGKSMDTNHRGGPPGFVRVIANGRNSTTTTTTMTNNSEEVTLIYPEYSGNRLYQTLGNLQVRPLVGICVPDFATGDVLYLTGETKILVGSDATRLLPHTKLAVRIRVTSARFVQDGLSFRGDVVDYSPYNPPVRRLAVESGGGTGLDAASQTSSAPATAKLTKREMITPTVARFTFRLGTQHANKPPRRWSPGQHVTFDFSEELDIGWSHMRDDDPTSLNDDYVRTFTVSSVPLPPSPVKGGGAGNSDGDGDGDGGDDLVKDGTEMQITVRKHGPVTGLLWRWNLQVPLEVPVLGFGGGEELRMVSWPSSTNGDGGSGGDGSSKARDMVFIAAGVGITPMLAQAPELLARGTDFTLLWTLRVGDVAFAVDVLERMPDLGAKMKLFITGRSNASGGEDEDENALLRKVEEELGCSEIVRGRITREAVVGNRMTGGPGGAHDGYGKGKEMKRRYLLCTGSEMLGVLLGWLEGEDVVYESFAY